MGQDDLKCYAVIAPVIAASNSLLFEVRADGLKRQPGEICFPGGRVEPAETPAEAASRELSEELLFPASDIELIAPLDILLTPYNSMIIPYLGYLNNYGWTFNSDEVKEVFDVPFDFFLQNDPEIYDNLLSVRPCPEFPHALVGREDYRWGSGTYPVPFYCYRDKVIWGLTARIVHNLVLIFRGAR